MKLNRTIGIHAWDPGLTAGNTSSSSGATAWLRHLIDSYRDADCQVAWISDRGEEVEGCDTYSCDVAARACDLVIVMWRWAMPAYPERNALYDEQMRLINLCLMRDTRVAVHDQDHQISPDDWAYLRHNNIHTYAPELAPGPGVTHGLFYPNPYTIHEPFAIADWRKQLDVIYVGNNYGRFNQTANFLSSRRGMPKDISIEAYGNWIEPNPERESPEAVMHAMPNVMFRGRLPQTELIDTLSKAYFTIHLFKESYAYCGFLTMRWAEAAAAGTLAFVPEDFFLPYQWDDLFRSANLKVRGAREMASAMNRFSIGYAKDGEQYQSALRLQGNFVRHYFTIDNWIKLVKGEI